MPEFLETQHDKFTFRVATDRLYLAEGLWALPLSPGRTARVRVGLTDFLQQRSGDVAAVAVKATGTKLEVSQELAEVETIKANVSVASPLAGTVVEVNPALARSPETVNEDPYGAGWLAVIEATDWERDRTKLLEPAGYLAVVDAEAAKESESP